MFLVSSGNKGVGVYGKVFIYTMSYVHVHQDTLALAIIICVVTDVLMNLAVAWNVYIMRKNHNDTMTLMKKTLNITSQLTPTLITAMESLGNQMIHGVKQLWKGYYGKAKQTMNAEAGNVGGLIGTVKKMVEDMESYKTELNDRTRKVGTGGFLK